MYRKGQPPENANSRCGLDFLISPGLTRWGAARKVSEDSRRGGPFLLIAQSAGLSRTPGAYRRLSRGFQHMERFYRGPFDPGTPI